MNHVRAISIVSFVEKVLFLRETKSVKTRLYFLLKQYFPTFDEEYPKGTFCGFIPAPFRSQQAREDETRVLDTRLSCQIAQPASISSVTCINGHRLARLISSAGLEIQHTSERSEYLPPPLTLRNEHD